MRELKLLTELLRHMDTDAQASLDIYNHPKARAHIIHGLLQESVSKSSNGSTTMDALTNKYDQANSRLMGEFWGNMYPAHDCHFHKSFTEYISCPFTCLTEIADCVERIANNQGRVGN